MKSILTAIFVLFACLQIHADPIQKTIGELIQDWDTDVAREFSEVKIRAAENTLEYKRTIRNLESTKKLIRIVSGDAKKLNITYSISQRFKWSSQHGKIYFPFVLCELVRVDADALMYYTETDESVLEELVGVLFFGSSNLLLPRPKGDKDAEGMKKQIPSNNCYM